MLKILKYNILFFVIAISTTCYADNKKRILNEGDYYIKYHSDINEYKKYVGEDVLYLDANGVNEYVIHKVKIMKAYPYTIVFSLKKKTTNKTIRLSVRRSNIGKYQINEKYTIPVILIGKLRKEKEKLIGTELKNDTLKFKYKFIDLECKPNIDNNCIRVVYVLENTMTKEKEYFPYIGRNIDDIFKKYLTGEYVKSLVSVEKPSNKSIIGETKIVEGDSVTKYRYIDNIIDIIIFAERDRFCFKLKNVHDNTIKIIWDDAVFVDCEGNSSQIIHSGIKYAQRGDKQVPYTIIKESSITDVAIPVNNIYIETILSINTWKCKPLFYSVNKINNPGKLKLMLPIQIDDIINEYVFVFDVKWVYDYPEMIKEEYLTM